MLSSIRYPKKTRIVYDKTCLFSHQILLQFYNGVGFHNCDKWCSRIMKALEHHHCSLSYMSIDDKFRCLTNLLFVLYLVELLHVCQSAWSMHNKCWRKERKLNKSLQNTSQVNKWQDQLPYVKSFCQAYKILCSCVCCIRCTSLYFSLSLS